jgi:hypothetical protein
MSQAIDDNAVVLPSKLSPWSKPPTPWMKLRENPSSRDIAKSENYFLEISQYRRDSLAWYLPASSDEAALLRELLPKTMDATFRERMRECGVVDSVLYRFRDGSEPSRKNLEGIAVGLGRPDVVAEPATPPWERIPPWEFTSAVRKAADDLSRSGNREDARAALVWYQRVADAVRAYDDSVTLSDLPANVREPAFRFYLAEYEVARGEARDKPVSDAAIRKRRSRRSARASRPAPDPPARTTT